MLGLFFRALFLALASVMQLAVLLGQAVGYVLIIVLRALWLRWRARCKARRTIPLSVAPGHEEKRTPPRIAAPPRPAPYVPAPSPWRQSLNNRKR